MTTNYLLRLTEIKPSKEVMVAILNISRTARMQFGYGHTSLWVLPNSKKTRQDIITQLQTLANVQDLSVLNLSKPVKTEEAAEVREILNVFEMDSSGINDIQLCAFLDSIIEGKQAYYFDFVNDPAPGNRTKIFIKPIEKHPEFSPVWLKQHSLTEEDITDRAYTVDDIEIETLEVDLEDDNESPNQNTEGQ